jgi:hypothetical protein
VLDVVGYRRRCSVLVKGSKEMNISDAKQTFALLMQKARTRKLTSAELSQLSEARQKIRVVRRPMTNKPIGKGKKAKENSEHNSEDKLTLGKAKAIAKSYGYRVVNTGYDYKITGPYFPTGNFSDSLDDLIATMHWEINRHAAQKNPKKHVLIYGNVRRIEAVKSQDHICDAECKAVGHRYFHNFTSKPKMYGLPDGSLLIKV